MEPEERRRILKKMRNWEVTGYILLALGLICLVCVRNLRDTGWQEIAEYVGTTAILLAPICAGKRIQLIRRHNLEPPFEAD